MELDWPVILINLGVWNQTNEETYLEIENKYSKYYTLHTIVHQNQFELYA